MAITYTWSVSKIKTLQEPQSNFVSSIDWTLVAKDGDLKAFTQNNIDLESSSDTFTPYEQLTEEIVIGWVKEKLGEEMVLDYQNSLAQKIEEINNPPAEAQNTTLPWVISNE
jgi:pullulanase/glycogen debranching enzyme